MYSYTYDNKTGGLLLNSTPTGFSKEPRPVYAMELDILGFDKYWAYEKQSERPYMWAEANLYYYRGELVAKLKGGNVYTPPEIIIPNDENGKPIMPQPKGSPLIPVDIEAMAQANREMLKIIEQTTIKKILNIYDKYKDKLDCFHVAFSGGKDSCVLLDLVKKALPRGSFVVVFGDTGMEFPDTYELVEKMKLQCDRDEIPFYIAKSHLDPKESWKMFGPPSRVLRWCCSVHKSAPQTLKLREITGKNNYRGLAFVGVRAYESVKRSEYDYFNDGKKIKGQMSHNSILEWTSAEIWLYIYANNVLVNEAYRKGNSRAGCLFCPMSINKADYIKNKTYKDDIEKYIELVKSFSGRNFGKDSYVSEGGWVSRRSGRDLVGNTINYSEKTKDGKLNITITSPKTDWGEWIKTLVSFNDIPFIIKDTSRGYVVQIRESYMKANPITLKFFKQVFRKSAYCVKCGVCQANCKFGSLKFDDVLKITNCKHCMMCHDINYGCLAYDSLKIPLEEKSMSINCFDSVLPKSDWFARFFKNKDDFWNMHGLGPNQVKTFKRFLKDSGLTVKNAFSELATLINKIGWETEKAWGIILINLASDNPQICWYVKKLELGKPYTHDTVISMLMENNSSKTSVSFVYSAFAKLCELPLGTCLHFGQVFHDGSIIRTKCSISDNRIILYGLFKFAQKCNDYKEFTLSTLLNDNIDRGGISPTRIFGLNRQDIIPILLGLSAKYPEFITASFTHDLEKIKLAQDKTPQDILDLFKEDGTNDKSKQ
jgi:phosphoadenosine phosphosulfate reductase